MSTENISFASLNLAPELLKALEEFGYKTPTPIQAQAIPVALEGRDLMAGAQTGTGKTAAFALPMLQRLLPQSNNSASPAKHPIRALILVPTRELAIQVQESIQVYAKHTHLRSLVVYGGVDIKTQTPALMKGVEILVATPGRLLDHVEQRTLLFDQAGFEQQGTDLTCRLDEAHSPGLGDHLGLIRCSHMGQHPTADIHALADIKRQRALTFEDVDACSARQCGQRLCPVRLGYRG